ncbi:hypothetical protein BGW36DRAFT_354944 [Talaromyces proteolyticus]|uniref:CCHC-type domain-containing protein n=1 Tax=Talaromyces proteolyticus TaxID=1131652 RepID=A0AAD4L4Q1_9EURO|nr:uncharacterized protein BGW36DRAFT_354944 [Talaromyces proteolyticus]KAH8703527.1 hypothetical protein BGW36DRAFT_354944 [Talaromyces proteolyticus]
MTPRSYTQSKFHKTIAPFLLKETKSILQDAPKWRLLINIIRSNFKKTSNFPCKLCGLKGHTQSDCPRRTTQEDQERCEVLYEYQGSEEYHRNVIALIDVQITALNQEIIVSGCKGHRQEYITDHRLQRVDTEINYHREELRLGPRFEGETGGAGGGAAADGQPAVIQKPHASPNPRSTLS